MQSHAFEHHPLQTTFAPAVKHALRVQVGLEPDDATETYLATMLCRFARGEAIHAIRNAEGQPVTSLAEMLAEGDIRLNADSFAREREVHKHVGDYLLFHAGMFPEELKRIRLREGLEALIDPIGQARFSYHVAGSFTHPPYTSESRTLQRLSEQFDAYRYGLSLLRSRFF